MANISDLSGDEREQRIAELKQKMQDAARQKQAAADAQAAQPDVEPEDAAASVEPTAEAAAETTDETQEPVAEASDPVDAEPEPAVVDATGAADEAVAVAAAVDATGSVESSAEDSEAKAKAAANKEMNRREFLTYSWGAATGALLLATGVVSFQFMYPRFKAGEFGGAFLMGPVSATPSTDAPPEAVPDGKFWWVNVEEEGPRAIYMVCTHLGCLYKWVGERNRFECPCHGSKFTREGLYIEGPAPRSLDHFVTILEEDIWVVDTGAKILGAPASESAAAGTG